MARRAESRRTIVDLRMPRYFFHIYNDLVTHDREGQDLPDADAAIREAMAGARSLAAEQVQRHGRLVLHHFIQVEDAEGVLLGTVTFKDAVDVQD